MLPVLYKFSLDSSGSQGLLYLLVLAVVAYIAWSGWRGAQGPLDPKTGEFGSPSRPEQIQRAVLFGVVGLVLGGVAIYYALPSTPLGKGKGEGIPIHTYGLLVGSGFMAAITVASWLALREWPGEEGLRKREQIFDLAFWVFIGAMVGSRVLFILVNWKDYAADPRKIFELGGGLVFYGGLIGASTVAFFYAKKNKIEFLRLADIAMPTVSLGQCLGRLGCVAAGCCWGDISAQGYKLGVNFPGSRISDIAGNFTSTPSMAFSSQSQDRRWVIEATGQVFDQAVPGAVRISEWVAQHGHSLPVHPTQLYESIGQLILFVGLLTMRRYRRFHGQIFAMWLMCYAVLRSSVELFRGDLERGTLHGFLTYFGANELASKVPLQAWYNISVSQFISLCLFTLGATLMYRKVQAVRSHPSIELSALPAT